MWHMALESILANRMRLALTALAVVLGVAFVSATLVLTDTMRGTFDTLITDAYAGVDVVVQGPEEFSSAMGGDTTRNPVPPEIVEQVATIDGVAMVEGEVQRQAILLDDHGNRLGTDTAPSLGGQAPANEELYAVELRDGRYPTSAGEVAIDAGTAGLYDLAIGDAVEVVTNGHVAGDHRHRRLRRGRQPRGRDPDAVRRGDGLRGVRGRRRLRSTERGGRRRDRS